MGKPPAWSACARIEETRCDLPAAPVLQEVNGRGGRVLLAFADHGHMPGNPGWLLRNSLLLAAVKFGVTEMEVACIRLRRGKPNPQHSLLLYAVLPGAPQGSASSHVTRICRKHGLLSSRILPHTL